MLLRSIQVANFRRVREASLAFGPGLNVLFGPNELGKSTLSEALRVGFLLPVESKAVEELVPWGTDLIPRIVIEFETPADAIPTDNADQSERPAIVWRITKTFGKGARGSSLLERVARNGRVVQEACGRDVEGRLRQLLAWGIPAPGGQGAPRGVPESYLTTALLGEQDKVTFIFEANLDEDRTESGRSLLTEALGALAQEPVVAALLDRLQARAREVFTETGQRRRTPNSPLVRCADEINRQEQRLRELEDRVRRSDEIEAAIQSLAEKQNEAEIQCRQLRRRLELSKAVLEAANQLKLATQQHSAMEKAQADFQTAEANFNDTNSQHSAAAEKLQSITNALHAAREELARVVTKRDQLRASVETSCEAKRSTLLARRDEADRLILSANEVIEAARHVDSQQAELQQANERHQSAADRADRAARRLELVRFRESQQTFQSAEAAMRQAEVEFQTRETFHQEATTAFQTLDVQWQAAREKVASRSAKRDQLQTSVEATREAKRNTLLARRDQSDRLIASANQAIEAARQVDLLDQELHQANEERGRARQVADRATKLLVLVDLRDQQQTLQSAESALRDADDDFLKQDVLHQKAATAFQTLDAQWQAARENVASLTATRDQQRLTAENSLNAQRTTLLAQRDVALREAELAAECLDLKEMIQSQAAEVDECERQRQETSTSLERARNAVDVARLDDDLLQLTTLLNSQETARQELSAQNATVERTQTEAKRLQDALDTAQRTIQTTKDALEQVRNQSRENQFRKETLLAGRLRALAALDHARNVAAKAHAATDKRQTLAETKRHWDDLTSQKSAADEALASNATELSLLAKTANRLRAGSLAIGVVSIILLTMTIVFSDGRLVLGTLAVFAGIAAAVLVGKLAAIQKALGHSTLERERLKEQRGELATKCLMAQSSCDAAQRDWNQTSQQITEALGSIEAAVDLSSKRLQAAQIELEKIEEDLQRLESISDQASANSLQQLASDLQEALQIARDHEGQVAAARQALDQARQRQFAAEARVTAADEALAAIPVGRDELDRQIAVARQDAGLELSQPAPSGDEAANVLEQIRANATAAESRLQVAKERFTNQSHRLAELSKKWDRPIEQVKAEVEQLLRDITAELESLEANILSAVAAAEAECQEAIAQESCLHAERDSVKTEAETAMQSLGEARIARDDRRLRFQNAVSASETGVSADPEYFARMKANLAKPGSALHPTTTMVDLEALTREIRRANDEILSGSRRRETSDRTLTSSATDERHRPVSSPQSLVEAENAARQSREELANAESSTQLAMERLNNRKSQLDELMTAFDQPPEIIRATEEETRSRIDDQLTALDANVSAELDSADGECQRAETDATRLSEQRDVAKSAVNAAYQPLSDARTTRDDRRLRFDAARQAAVISLPNSEYFAQIKTKIAKRNELFSELLVANLAAIEQEIDELFQDSGQALTPLRPTLMDAENEDRQAHATLAEANNLIRLASQRLTDRQTRHDELRAQLNAPPSDILAAAEQIRIQVEAELETLETNATAEIDVAEREYQQAQALEKQLNEQQTQAKAEAEIISATVATARLCRDEARIRLGQLRPNEPTLKVDAAETRLAAARLELEREFAVCDVSETEMTEMATQLSLWTKTLQEQTQALDKTRGQLSLVGGAVVREQLEQERESLERLRASSDELELEFQATQHLLGLLKQTDAKHAAHLGNSLAKPVSELFLKLTDNRYSDVLLAPNLSLQKITTDSSERDLKSLSVGARHQLATLIRLSLASYLKTTLVLDDQLAHSDPDRLLWFRNQLRASADENGIQVIVITCRPLDYLSPSEFETSTSNSKRDGYLTVTPLANFIFNH